LIRGYAKVMQEHLRQAVSKLTPLVTSGEASESKLLNEAPQPGVPDEQTERNRRLTDDVGVRW